MTIPRGALVQQLPVAVLALRNEIERASARSVAVGVVHHHYAVWLEKRFSLLDSTELMFISVRPIKVINTE